MALLTKKQATTKIYRLAKAIAEIGNGELSTSKTQIEFHLIDDFSEKMLFISKWDGQIISIRPSFESQFIKVKVYRFEDNKYILDVK